MTLKYQSLVNTAAVIDSNVQVLIKRNLLQIPI